MASFGGFSQGGLGFGVAFALHDRFTATSQKIQHEFRKLDAATAAFEARITRSMATMKTGATMMLAGGLLVAPFVVASRHTKDFEEAMSAVRAVTQATDEDFRTLSEAAIELGKATKFTAMEAAAGQKYLGLAGFKTNEILSTMPAMLDLASAGNMDLARTADIVSDTLTAMSLSADRATEVADIMAATITKSNTDIAQMGEALKMATASADMLGVTMPQLSAMLGMLGDIGIKGTMAGTSIREMMNRITQIGKSEGSLKALQQLGLSMDDLVDSQGNLRHMTELIPMFVEGVRKLPGNLAQAVNLSELFGVRGSMAFSAFTKAGAKDYTEFVRTLEQDSAGLAKRVSEQMLDNLAGDITKLQSMWEATMITLGKGVNRALRPVVQVLTTIVELAGAFLETRLGQAIATLTVVFGALLVLVGLMTAAKGALTFAVLKLTKAFGQETQAMLIQTIVQKGVIAGMKRMAVAAWASLGPYALIAGAILAVVWMYTKLSKAMTEGNEKFARMATVLLMLGGPIGWVVWAISGITRGLREFDNMQRDAFGNFKGSLGGVLGFFQKIGGIIRGVSEIWKSWNGEFFTLSEETADKLESLGILDFVLAFGTYAIRFKEFFKGFKDGVVEVFNELKPLIRGFYVFIDTVLFKPLGVLFDALGFTLGKNTSELSAWARAGRMFARSLGFIFKLIVNPIGVVIGLLKSMWEGLQDLGNWIRDIGANLVSNLWEGIKAKFSLLNPLNVADKILGLFGIGGGESGEPQPTASSGAVAMPTPSLDYSFYRPTPMPAQSNAPTGDFSGGQQVIQLIMDGDIVADKIIDKNRLKNARQ